MGDGVDDAMDRVEEEIHERRGDGFMSEEEGSDAVRHVARRRKEILPQLPKPKDPKQGELPL